MRHLLVAACAGLSLSWPAVSVHGSDTGVDLKAGTLGAGVGLSKSFSDKFSLGLGINSL